MESSVKSEVLPVCLIMPDVVYNSDTLTVVETTKAAVPLHLEQHRHPASRSHPLDSGPYRRPIIPNAFCIPKARPRSAQRATQNTSSQRDCEGPQGAHLQGAIHIHAARMEWHCRV